MNNEVTPEILGEVITSLAEGFDAELYAKTEEELEEYWHWHWGDKCSVEWNTYQFFDLLELYSNFCRRWEEKHNGGCCVVERVRDKYVMPKVRIFLEELAKHQEVRK